MTADGKRLAFQELIGKSNVYVADLQANKTHISNPSPLTLSEGQNMPMGWTADSKAVIFESNRGSCTWLCRKMRRVTKFSLRVVC